MDEEPQPHTVAVVMSGDGRAYTPVGDATGLLRACAEAMGGALRVEPGPGSEQVPPMMVEVARLAAEEAAGAARDSCQRYLLRTADDLDFFVLASSVDQEASYTPESPRNRRRRRRSGAAFMAATALFGVWQVVVGVMVALGPDPVQVANQVVAALLCGLVMWLSWRVHQQFEMLMAERARPRAGGPA